MEQAEKLMNQHYQFKSKFMKDLEADILNPSFETMLKDNDDEPDIDVEVISCPSYSAGNEFDEEVPDSDEERYWNKLMEEEKKNDEPKKKSCTYSFFSNDSNKYYKMCTCCIDSAQAGGCPIQKKLNRDFQPFEEKIEVNIFPYYDDDSFIPDSREVKPDSSELVMGLQNDVPLALLFELCEKIESLFPIETIDKPFNRIDYCGTKTNNHRIVSEMMSLILSHEEFENHFVKLVLNESLPDVYSYTFKYINVDEYYRVIDHIISYSKKEDELYQKQFLNCLLQIWIMRDYITFFDNQYHIGIRDGNLNFDSKKATLYINEYGYSYKMMILLTHLMNHYYTRSIYPSMNSMLLHIFYINDMLSKSNHFNQFDL